MDSQLEISVDQLKQSIPQPWVVVDVRTDNEYKIDHLPKSIHIPLHELPHRFAELNADAALAIICGSGIRSMQATLLLREQGFSNVYNVSGGVKAWAQHIDPNFKLG